MKYTIFRLIASFMSRRSPETLRRLARFMAFVLWYCTPSRRRVAAEALQKHLHLPHGEAVRLARRSFEENFLSFLEIFHAERFFMDSCVSEIINPEILTQVRAESAPIVVATAHFGSWELMPGLAAEMMPHHHHHMVVVRRHQDKAVNRLMAEMRGIRGMQVIDHRQASGIVLPKLRDRGVVAFLVDHNTSRSESVFLPFMEDTAAVNMGPAMLALRAKAAVYPVFLARDARGKRLLYLYPPLYTEQLGGSIAERVEAIARFYTDTVADAIKKHPEQWFWMHKRWKTRPPAEGDTQKKNMSDQTS